MQKSDSVGLALLRSIIESESRTFACNLRPELFVQDERAAYQFFVEFYRQLGRLPSLQIMQENGFPLPPADGSPAYLMKRARERAVVNICNSSILKLQHAVARLDLKMLRTLVGQMTRSINAFSQDVFLLTDAAELVMQEYGASRGVASALQGTTLGWAGLDEVTGGAIDGDLVTWIAAPNVGASYLLAKSSLAAHEQDRKVLLVSMEMGAAAMARRLIGLRSGINPDFIKRGTLSMWGEEIVYETIKQTRDEAPFVLVSGNIAKSVDIVDTLIQEHTPDVVYIDAQYLLLPSQRPANMQKFELLDAVGIEVQQMALARRLAVHQSVQCNREPSDFEEGDIHKINGTETVEQISSIVISIRKGHAPNESTTRVLDIVKSREGSLAKVLINFLFNPINFSQVLPSESGISNID